MISTPYRPRGLAAEALSEKFIGTPAERIQQARLTSAYLDRVLSSIDAGHLEATATEIARLEGASFALQMVSDPGRRSRSA